MGQPMSRVAQIEYESGDVEGLLVTPAGSNLFRLEESSLLEELRFHDVIEVECESSESLRFLRVAVPSNLESTTWFIPKELDDSAALSSLLERVVGIGGNWEKVFGGVLMLHLPPDQEATIVGEVDTLLRPFRTSNLQP